MTAMLGANEELLVQLRADSRELATLKRERKDEGGPPPHYGAERTAPFVSTNTDRKSVV